VLLALLFAAHASAAPNLETLTAVWAKNQSVIAEHAGHPVTLESSDFRTIVKGGIAKRRRREAGPDGAIGIGWTPHTRAAVWVAIIDDIHNTMVSSLTEQRLDNAVDDQKLLYQRLDLPWPFSDRQWVIAIQNNPRIAHASLNQVWERSWKLEGTQPVPPGDPGALWVPMINGAWLAIEADEGTLLIYQARTTIGGAIPDDLVTRWALATLDEMMSSVFSRAAEIPAHYRAKHAPIKGGDNLKIMHFSPD
jgi:hypothetical protein